MKVSKSTLNVIRQFDTIHLRAIDEIILKMTEVMDMESPKRANEFETIWFLAGREETKKALKTLQSYLQANNLTSD
jgi:hypothetical protein